MTKLFDDFERTDSTPMRDSSSPTGHVCPECRWPLNPDWTGDHRPGCTIASWPLSAFQAEPPEGDPAP